MKKMKSESNMLVYEIISICLIYIAGLAVRVKFINTISGMLTGNLSIFENATIKASFSNELNSYSHGITQVYAYILNGTCAFLGNKPMAVICLQFLLQMLGMIFIFFAVRNLSGRVSALLTMVSITFLPIVFQQINVVSYETVLFFMISIVFVLYSLFFHKRKFINFKNPSWLLWILVLGFFSGVMIALDVWGILLFCLGVFFIIGKGKSSSKSLIQNRSIVFLTYLFGNIGGIASIIYVLASDKGISFKECGINTIHLYFSDITFLYKDRPTILTVFVVVSVATIVQLIINFIIKPKKINEIVIEDKIMEQLVIEDLPVEKPIKYIPNPLPLPKKHVKKELNYSFEIPEEKMKYDIEELIENDDFDLK